MKSLIITGALLLFGFVALATTKTQQVTVHFASDSFKLDAEAQKILSDFLSKIKLSSDYEFQIDGHTDQQGNNRYNNALSQKRAEVVKKFLEQNGIESATLFTEAHGKKQLLNRYRDSESMRQNRRVDVVYKQFYFENIEEVMHELAQATQNSFQIESTKGNTLTCRQGSRIFIPDHGFQDSLGNPYNGVVNIEVIEALNFHDFWANGLATISDGSVLESGGMLNVTAFTENGIPLDLIKGTSLRIAFPIGNAVRADSMFLFLSNTGTNWQATPFPALTRGYTTLPDKPQHDIPDVDFPEYEFGGTRKPRQPLMTVYPSLPPEPRPESYNQQPKWYEFFSRKRIKRSNQLRYEIAMLNYKTRLERYDRRVEKYRRDSAQFPVWIEEYERKLENWKTEKARSFDDFTNTDWKEALHRYMYLSDIEKEKYASRFAVWDSIRTAKRNAYNAMLISLGFPSGKNPNYYLFAETKLGWLNCDKFQNLPPSERFQLAARIPESTVDQQVVAILPRSKSLVRMDKNSDLYYISPSLPFREEVLVLAYKIEDGGLQIARSLTSKKYSVKLEYQSIKVSEFRAFLKGIGG